MIRWGWLVLSLFLAAPAWAGAKIDLNQSGGGITELGGAGNAALFAPGGNTSYRGNITADTLVKTGAGFLHTITCSSDAAATAGSLIVYDNTAESGTVLWSWTISAVEYQPRTLTFDVAFSTGLYLGFTTTADVNCTVSYR